MSICNTSLSNLCRIIIIFNVATPIKVKKMLIIFYKLKINLIVYNGQNLLSNYRIFLNDRIIQLQNKEFRVNLLNNK